MAVMAMITVRRRRGLVISEDSQPWNWYVSAVTMSRNAASNGSTGRKRTPFDRDQRQAEPEHRGHEDDEAQAQQRAEIVDEKRLVGRDGQVEELRQRQRLGPLQFGHHPDAPEEQEADDQRVPREEQVRRRGPGNRVLSQEEGPDEERDRDEQRTDRHDDHQHGIEPCRRGTSG